MSKAVAELKCREKKEKKRRRVTNLVSMEVKKNKKSLSLTRELSFYDDVKFCFRKHGVSVVAEQEK